MSDDKVLDNGVLSEYLKQLGMKTGAEKPLAVLSLCLVNGTILQNHEERLD
jgi:hypothetical protein